MRALIAGDDGLNFYRRIVEDAPRFLLSDGFLCLELGDGQCHAVQQLCEKRGCAAVNVVKDLQGKERVLIARLKQ